MNNLEYLYNHLPTRFQRSDNDLFLKRFLQFFGETLDQYDLDFEGFFRQINPVTARIEFVVFWLQQLFDWNWFPRWFADADKRRLYGNMAAHHLARRGTAGGIKEWLADFYIESVVHKSPQFYEETFYGEPLIFVTEPLVIIVEIGKVAPPNYREDMSVYGESFYGEAFCSNADPLYTKNEVENLLRHVQPNAQEIVIYNRYLGEN